MRLIRHDLRTQEQQYVTSYSPHGTIKAGREFLGNYARREARECGYHMTAGQEELDYHGISIPRPWFLLTDTDQTPVVRYTIEVSLAVTYERLVRQQFACEFYPYNQEVQGFFTYLGGDIEERKIRLPNGNTIAEPFKVSD